MDTMGRLLPLVFVSIGLEGRTSYGVGKRSRGTRTKVSSTATEGQDR